ncbi:MAG TPA: hypothetical protein VJL88_05350 [Nitrospira sp.]|nr:hypothetical protein [Nitrospira sp.]
MRSDQPTAGFFVPIEASLEAVVARLDALSLQPEFALQRELGLARALRPYVENGSVALAALPQEIELANLWLFCDFYPDDGQLTLIEQLRDVITEHIPDDERVWLDPLKHSYIDLLELATAVTPHAPLTLQSLGDAKTFVLPYADFATDLSKGQVLLTRVISDPRRLGSDHAVWAGCGLILSPAEGKALYEKTRDRERRMEMSSGELVLGEWQEFTKRFGHVLLWSYAEMRVDALIDAVAHIQYRTPNGGRYLYAIAMYDHHEYRFFADGLSGMEEWRAESPALQPESEPVVAAAPPRRWIQRADSSHEMTIVARLTLTSSQLIVECDSRERLNDIKHRLAAAFGFALHFRGETLTPPYRGVTIQELESHHPVTSVISHAQDRAMLQAFLEKAYLEWSDQPHHMLGGQTPRHAAARPATREAVARLILEMEATDLGLRRSGQRAYDYNILRGHVGLDNPPLSSNVSA